MHKILGSPKPVLKYPDFLLYKKNETISNIIQPSKF
jgi:hypothetical protein